MRILSEARPLPFQLDDDAEIDETLRLKYRYLDMRRPHVPRAFQIRDQVCRAARDYLHAEGFLEVETRVLTRSTPEGARDFLVPSRLQARCSDGSRGGTAQHKGCVHLHVSRPLHLVARARYRTSGPGGVTPGPLLFGPQVPYKVSVIGALTLSPRHDRAGLYFSLRANVTSRRHGWSRSSARTSHHHSIN